MQSRRSVRGGLASPAAGRRSWHVCVEQRELDGFELKNQTLVDICAWLYCLLNLYQWTVRSNWMFGLWSGWSASASAWRLLHMNKKLFVQTAHTLYEGTHNSLEMNEDTIKCDEWLSMWTQTVAITFTVGVSCVFIDSLNLYLCFTVKRQLPVCDEGLCVGSKTMITDSFCLKKLLAPCVISFTHNEMSFISQPQWLKSLVILPRISSFFCSRGVNHDDDCRF